MILRFADGTFSDSYIHTVGLDFKTNVVEVDGERVKLQVNGAGSLRFCIHVGPCVRHVGH
jgi:hypothetical protein